MKTLSHVNIVQYLGAAKQGVTLDIFLEYVPGGSIASLIKRFGRLSEDIVRQFTKQILIGLLYLHTNRIVHRDIKGANILINVEGIIKLADFGASKKIQDIMTLSTDFKSLIGTPNFMAPEVITQEGHSRPADIWSVGCTVLEMFTGKPPFSECTTAAAVMFKIASTTEPPMFSDCISPEARDFLILCFERDQSKRPTAMQLLLHPWLSDIEVPIHGKGPTANMSPTSIANATNNAKIPSPLNSPKSPATPQSPRPKKENPVTIEHQQQLSSKIEDDNELRPLPSAQPVIPTARRKGKGKFDEIDEGPNRSATPDFTQMKSKKDRMTDTDSPIRGGANDLMDDMQPLKSQRKPSLTQEPKEGYDNKKSISKFLKNMSEWQSRSCKDMKFLVQMARKKSSEDNANAAVTVEPESSVASSETAIRSPSVESPSSETGAISSPKKRNSSIPSSSRRTPKSELRHEKKRRNTTTVPPRIETDEEFPVRSGKESPRESRYTQKSPRITAADDFAEYTTSNKPIITSHTKQLENMEKEEKKRKEVSKKKNELFEEEQRKYREQVQTKAAYENSRPEPITLQPESPHRVKLLKPRSAPSRPQALSKSDLENIKDYEKMFEESESDLSPLSKQTRKSKVSPNAKNGKM
jgi:serine/threonine protein kinase